MRHTMPNGGAEVPASYNKCTCFAAAAWVYPAFSRLAGTDFQDDHLFWVLRILNSSCHFSNTFGPYSPEILVFSRFPGIFSWPFPLLFSLRDVCKGKLSAFTRHLIQKPGGRTCGFFLCMGVDVHGGVHAGKAQQLSDIFKDAPP